LTDWLKKGTPVNNRVPTSALTDWLEKTDFEARQNAASSFFPRVRSVRDTHFSKLKYRKFTYGKWMTRIAFENQTKKLRESNPDFSRENCTKMFNGNQGDPYADDVQGCWEICDWASAMVDFWPSEVRIAQALEGLPEATKKVLIEKGLYASPKDCLNYVSFACQQQVDFGCVYEGYTQKAHVGVCHDVQQKLRASD